METESASTGKRDVHSVVAQHPTLCVAKHTMEDFAKDFVLIVETDDNCITFAATVHITLPIRTASQDVSFAFKTFNIKILNLVRCRLRCILTRFFYAVKYV